MNYLDLTIEEIHKALLEGKTNPLELTKEAIKGRGTYYCKKCQKRRR